MKEYVQLVILILDNQRYALYLPVVEKVVRAVEVTPLPKAPDIVLGVINVQGEIIPVVNIRKRFQLPEREFLPTDQIIIVRTSQRVVALAVDGVTDLLEFSADDIIPPNSIVPGTAYVEGLVTIGEDIVLIQNLDKCHCHHEETTFEATLSLYQA